MLFLIVILLPWREGMLTLENFEEEDIIARRYSPSLVASMCLKPEIKEKAECIN